MLIRTARRRGTRERCAIAVMAKASAPGRTKTRLSPPLTREQAAELNTAFLADIAGNLTVAAEHADIAAYMAFGPPETAPFFEAHVPADIGLMEAWTPHFGDCLEYTLRSLFDLGYGAACVLNSDSPTLPTSVLVAAADALAQPGERIVIGPSTDGGYYLLGMQTPRRRLFEEIAWSTPQVMRQTLERAAEVGVETLILPEWYDVDDAASLRLLARETLAGERFSGEMSAYGAPHTAAWLRRLPCEGESGW